MESINNQYITDILTKLSFIPAENWTGYPDYTTEYKDLKIKLLHPLKHKSNKYGILINEMEIIFTENKHVNTALHIMEAISDYGTKKELEYDRKKLEAYRNIICE